MAYTNLELLRKTIADPIKFAIDKQLGDGTSTIFKVSHERIEDGTYKIFVNDEENEVETDFTIDLERGVITFLEAIPLNYEIRMEYFFSAFSELELTEFLALDGNDVNKSALRCVDILLADASRRFDYSSGQTEVKASQVFKNLKELREVFKDNITDTNGNAIMVNRINDAYRPPEEIEDDFSRRDY